MPYVKHKQDTVMNVRQIAGFMFEGIIKDIHFPFLPELYLSPASDEAGFWTLWQEDWQLASESDVARTVVLIDRGWGLQYAEIAWTKRHIKHGSISFLQHFSENGIGFGQELCEVRLDIAVKDVWVLNTCAFFDFVECIYFLGLHGLLFDFIPVLQILFFDNLELGLNVGHKRELFGVMPWLRGDAREVEQLRERSLLGCRLADLALE